MIELITTEDGKKWDSIVKKIKKYDVYYLSGYVKAFQLNGEGQALLIYFENDTTRAINVVIKRDIAECEYFRGKISKKKYFDITTPYGYGGFIIEGNDKKSLEKEYIDFCVKENIICEFVRFHPIIENFKNNTIYELNCLGDTITMDTSDKDTIWKNITSKNRNMIRKAYKSGMKIYWGRNPQIIKSFMKIYNETMDRDEANSYYYFSSEFYESILEDLKDNAMWFYTMLGEEIIAISIFIFSNKKVHYHLSGSLFKYRKLAPTNLLLYEVALWANENGYKKLHLGGGIGSSKDGLYKFKKSFYRGENSKFYIGKRIFNKASYEKLVEIRKLTEEFDENTKYFPIYRR